MCTTCGCSPDEEGHDHAEHDHDDHAHHEHRHGHDPHSHVRRSRIVDLNRAVLEKNGRLAEQNRGWLGVRGVVAVNLLSSPGAGKTTLLERTIADLGTRLKIAVVEGDQATSRDAERIRRAGAPALQINTGAGCHLDATMVANALSRLDPPRGSLVVIENVGNLVCPALFDLGEEAKIVVASVSEGEDKPLKYPHAFRSCRLVLLNKVDLAPYVRFDRAEFDACLREVNPDAQILPVSAHRGDGMDAWYAWIEARVSAVNGSRAREGAR